jgi:hypothetical protein
VTRVIVQQYCLRSIPGQRAVEVDDRTGAIVHVIAADHQVPNVGVAASMYAALHGLPYQGAVSLERAA